MAMPDLMSASRKRTTSVCWPLAVDERLDRLHELARFAGEQTSRAQILAALVAQAPLDGDELGLLVREYRRMGVGDFEAKTGPVSRVSRQPGPRAAVRAGDGT